MQLILEGSTNLISIRRVASHGAGSPPYACQGAAKLFAASKVLFEGHISGDFLRPYLRIDPPLLGRDLQSFKGCRVTSSRCELGIILSRRSLSTMYDLCRARTVGLTWLRTHAPPLSRPCRPGQARRSLLAWAWRPEALKPRGIKSTVRAA